MNTPVAVQVIARARPALPYLLALLVLAAYGATFAIRAQRPGGALAFAVLGTSNTPGNRGYDGQYYYRIALAPLGGRRGLDKPSYRYQRIGYPLVARLVALGRQGRVASALVLVNVAAIALGVLFLALLLRRSGMPSVYSLAYALYAGQVGAFWRDLAEPLSFALVALALLLLRPNRIWPVALVLLAAGLTKETALLFVIGLAVHLSLRVRIRSLVELLVLVGVPYALWQLVLWLSLGQTGFADADHPPHLPLGGLVGVRGDRQLLFELAAVVLPALLCLVLVWLGLRHAWRIADASAPLTARRFSAFLAASTGQHASRPTRLGAVRATAREWFFSAWEATGDLPTLLVLVNLAFVLWLPAHSYADLWASARNAQGLVLAALIHPALSTTRFRWPLLALWACCAPLLWWQ